MSIKPPEENANRHLEEDFNNMYNPACNYILGFFQCVNVNEILRKIKKCI